MVYVYSVFCDGNAVYAASAYQRRFPNHRIPRVFPIAVRQVFNYENESQLRSPHRGHLKGPEG
jgi:hypothetical protein